MSEGEVHKRDDHMDQKGDQFVKGHRLEIGEEPDESGINGLDNGLLQGSSFRHSVLELIGGGCDGLIPAHGGEVADGPNREDPEGVIEAPDGEISEKDESLVIIGRDFILNFIPKKICDGNDSFVK
jgi:hypothetical protein